MKLLSLLSLVLFAANANAFTVNWSTSGVSPSSLGTLSGTVSTNSTDIAVISGLVNNAISAALNAKCSQCVARAGIPGSMNYSVGVRTFSYTPTVNGYQGETQTYQSPNAMTMSCNNQGAQNFCASDAHNQNCAVSGSKACEIQKVCVANGPSAANVTCTFQNQNCNGPLTGQTLGVCSKPTDSASGCTQTSKTPDSCVPGAAAIPPAAYTKKVSAR